MGTPRRHLLMLLGAATAPVALGVSMHLEHEATLAAAMRVAVVPVPEVVAIPVPLPPVAESLPEPEPVVEPQPEPEPAAEPEPEPEPPQLPPEDVDEDERDGTPLAWEGYLREMAFVLPGEAPLVVLSYQPDDAWIAGEPTQVEYTEYVHSVVRREVDGDALPEAITAFVGTQVRAFADGAEACVATVGEPFLRADTQGEIEEGPEGEGVTASTWAEGRRLLVAPLEGPRGCAKATWARPLDRAAPELLAPRTKATRREVASARRAFLETPMLRYQRTSYAQWSAEMTADGYVDPFVASHPKLRHNLVSRTWGPDDATPTHVVLDVPSLGGCGTPPTLWGIAAISHGGAHVDAVAPQRFGEPRALLDLDGDGTLEILAAPRDLGGGHSLLRFENGRLQALARMPDAPFFGCPC